MGFIEYRAFPLAGEECYSSNGELRRFRRTSTFSFRKTQYAKNLWQDVSNRQTAWNSMALV